MGYLILLVEDDKGVVSFIRKGLSEEGHSISIAYNGTDGINMIQNSSYDLIILDIMLPDKNGIEVCQKIRELGYQIPILYLSALSTSENIALGLNSGGDDYLVKPFKFIELNARINALCRRKNNQSQKQAKRFAIADLVVDDSSKSVSRGNQMIQLTATEYRLLLVLIKNAGKVLSRMDLLENAWDINFNMGTNVVDVYINYLRKKIDSEKEVKLIHTVIGMGYVLKET